uniref:Secreted protein n=1 Tax=uncultured bacterium esnapd12 TaxID=1366592 RepID=S5UB86_9BACT|nr:hypothetical protein [uncultured bacterium esnapd12]
MFISLISRHSTTALIAAAIISTGTTTATGTAHADASWDPGCTSTVNSCFIMWRPGPDGKEEKHEMTLSGVGPADEDVSWLWNTTQVKTGQGKKLTITLLNADDDTPAEPWTLSTPAGVEPEFQDVPEGKKVALPITQESIKSGDLT